MKDLGMPYMGSKRKIAPELMKYIVNQNPNAKFFYDLFGGGGAMSFIALQYPQFEKVIYNELNTGVCELLRKIQHDGVTNEFYQWIDRETFYKHKNDNDWFGGLCKIIWSFGNNQIGYIYGKHIEMQKELLHYVIVNQCEKSLDLFNKIYDTNLYMPIGETINERRLKLKTQINKRLDLQQLGRLEQLEQLQQLEILNCSFEKVLITTHLDQTVIYCDIPYMKDSTIKRYKNENDYYGGFDYELFKKFVLNSPFKIYVSSYEFNDLYECKLINHRCTFDKKRVIEKLFCNRQECEYNLFNH